jgi:hypothetical protein
MKKRKSPVLLLSILLVLVGSAVMFGMSQGGGDKPTPPQPDTDQLGQERTAPSAKEVADRVKSTTADGAKAAVPTATMGPKPGQPAKPPAQHGPSIAIANQHRSFPKPTPNPSGTTSSQWYDH